MSTFLISVLCLCFHHSSYAQIETIHVENMTSGWTLNSAAYSTHSNCPNSPTCVRLGWKGYAYKTFSTEGYHSISFTLKTATTTLNGRLEGSTYDNGNIDPFTGYWDPPCSVTVPQYCNSYTVYPTPLSRWDDRSSFRIRFDVGDQSQTNIFVYIADLQISGIRDTPNPFHPTSNPSMNPTIVPTASTVNPTASTVVPTSAPSDNPTVNPTAPTVYPTQAPTSTGNPTSLSSTLHPTLSPSDHPTLNPSSNPSITPSNIPSNSPSVTFASSSAPTASPLTEPSKAPTYSPSDAPTSNPMDTDTGLTGGGGYGSNETIIIIVVVVAVAVISLIACLVFIILYQRKQLKVKASETQANISKTNTLQRDTTSRNQNKHIVPDASPMHSAKHAPITIMNTQLPTLPPSEIQLEGIKTIQSTSGTNELENDSDDGMYLSNDHMTTAGNTPMTPQ